MKEHLYNPRHSVAFRGLRLTPALVDELERFGIVLMMTFCDVEGECFLQLATPGELKPKRKEIEL
jgi:hypothetical protein